MGQSNPQDYGDGSGVSPQTGKSQAIYMPGEQGGELEGQQGWGAGAAAFHLGAWGA